MSNNPVLSNLPHTFASDNDEGMFDGEVYSPPSDALDGLLPLTETQRGVPTMNSEFTTPIAAAPTRVLAPENDLGFPATLPLEVALGTAPLNELLLAYRISQARWNDISQLSLFQRTVEKTREYIAKNENAAFKIKARIQAEALLDTSYGMIHDDSTPAAVRADLIKHTMKWADFTDTGEKPAAAGAGFQIQINFNGRVEPETVIQHE